MKAQPHNQERIVRIPGLVGYTKDLVEDEEMFPPEDTESYHANL